MAATNNIIVLLLLFLAGGRHELLVAALGSNDVVHIRYGYFDNALPIHAACGRGWLNLAKNVQEDTPEYIVECFPQSSGSVAASRLDNAQLDIASLGSTPWAQAVARGLPLEEIYISVVLESTEGIYVRNGDAEIGYVGINSPSDLVNRTIGVPFGSTTHYQTLFLVDLFDLRGLVKVVHLSPTEIIKAWKEKTIDGAACWGNARDYMLANSGRELISAGSIGRWGAPTYDTVVARRLFANQHPKFMKHLLGILSRIDDSFLDRLGLGDPNNAARWAVEVAAENDTNQTTKLTMSLMNSMIDANMIAGEERGNPSYDQLVSKRKGLEIFNPQTALEQLTCRYMGNGDCQGPTGQRSATISTIQFLLEQKSIPVLRGETGESFFNPSHLVSSRTGNGVVTPLGPYENETVVVDNEPGNLGPDPVLGLLEKLDNDAAKSQYAKFEVGRASEGSLTAGDSNCRDDHIISDELVVNGTIGDGANALPGRSYSDNQFCRWVIHPIDSLVEVRVQKLWLWSGDFLRLYSGGIEDCPGGNRERMLLAQLSGMYDDAENELPPFRSSTCIVVEFKTDGNQERGYAVTEDFGDGFELFYSRDNVPEGDCNGRDSDADGLCLCGGTAWGSDCSHKSYCVGTTKVLIEEGVEYAIQSSIQATKEVLSSSEAIPITEHLYPNDLDCLYELELAFDTQEPKVQYDMIKVELHYDLEDTFDLLTLQAGSGGDNSITQYAILSGSHPSPEVYYVPVDGNGMASIHLTTDDKGRRRGFYAKVSGHSSAATECWAGQFGSQCESKHCLALNRLYQTQHSLNNQFNAGRVISQHSSKAVRAMPWAPDGGCTWEIQPEKESTGSIRLVFETFDLEPSQPNAVSDKAVIKSNGMEDSEDIQLFSQSCKEDDDCKFEWQTGTCLAEGVCKIHDEVQLDIGADIFTTLVLLATDRNDGGKIYSGIDFEVHYVQSCPAGADNNCIYKGGTCSAQGLCTCSDGIACDCSCADTDDSSSVGMITFGVVVGGMVALFVVMFLFYKHKKEKKIEDQQKLLISTALQLKKRDVELEALSFKLGTSKYSEAVECVDTLLERESSDEEMMEKLALVKSCIIRGDDSMIHVPDNLRSKNTEEAYILQNFGGVSRGRKTIIAATNKITYHTPTRKMNASERNISAAIGVNTATNKFLANKRRRDLSNRRYTASTKNLNGLTNSMKDGASLKMVLSVECLPEFINLDVSRQTKMFELLSFSNLKKWDFNVFDVASIDQENALLFVAWAVICSPHSQIAMAKELGFVGSEEGKAVSGSLDIDDFDGYNFFDLDLAIDANKLSGYIRAIQGDYQDVPYHNRVHAADVVQSTNSLIQMADESIAFQKEDLFLLLIASVIHDVKHPGRNNSFQVNTFSDLSLVHNDQSVLENEHVSHAFKLLIHGDHHFLHNVKPSKFAGIRKKIVQAVLHTDMTSHFATVSKIKSNATGKPWDELEPEMQWEVLMYMLHMADISNPAKGDPMFKLWTDRCLQEFFAQGDKEREMGLAISMMCDRNTTKRPDSQIGFINFVVKPAYEVLAGVIPAVGVNVLPVIESNLEYWGEEKDMKVIVEEDDAEENI